MEKLHSYPKLYNVGHRAVQDIFNEPVLVQEKVDGSQISFGVVEGELKIRSKGAVIHLEAPDKMFSKGVAAILKAYEEGKIVEEWVFRGEYLRKPKHNVIPYNRIPNNHIVIFDIEMAPTHFLKPLEVVECATEMGFDSLDYEVRMINSVDDVKDLMDKESFLGGAKVEGVVFKNYERFTIDGKTMMAKYVSEAFKEVHRTKVYKDSNKDIVQQLIEAYATEARWRKAIHHLRDMGELDGEPKDIGKLIKEVNQDVLAECEDEIKEALFKWGWKQISRGLTKGLPEWYKGLLLEQQFEEDN